jgi:hypothetical protein
VGTGPGEPTPPRKETEKPAEPTESPATHHPPRVAAPSIGDGIKLVDVRYAPDEALLKTLGVGLRITDNYRDNVTAIIKGICDAGRKHDVEIDVLLLDGHDMLRKARERAVVFYPWKPKPFGV